MAQREERALSAPIVFVNGVRMKVIPKSVTNEYPGTASVRAVSAGGGDIEMVRGVNLEEMKCKIAFKLPNTAEYADFARAESARRIQGGSVSIKIVEDSLQDHYDQCELINKLEIPRDPEGEITFEYEGRFAAF